MFGDFHIIGVAQDGAIWLTIAGVENKLTIPDANLGFAWAEDGQHSTQIAAIGCELDMFHNALEHLFFCFEMPQVSDV